MIARCVHFHAHDLVDEKIAIIGVGCPALLVAVPPPFIELFVAARVLCWDLGRFLEPDSLTGLRISHDLMRAFARPR